MQSVLETAIRIATEAHAGQTDKSGQPYILHPLAVMMAVEGVRHKTVAVLHDVVEDTDVTLDDLLSAGIPPLEVAAVDAITKRRGEDYETYLSRVLENDMAKAVKIKDIGHNMSRLTNLRPGHAGSLARKYTKALQFMGVA